METLPTTMVDGTMLLGGVILIASICPKRKAEGDLLASNGGRKA